MQNLAMDSKTLIYSKENLELMDNLSIDVKESTYRPKHHIYPECGLMNDPNGLAYFNGKYHVFFQWYPFGPIHGLKHWGLTTSDDLVNWTKQEVALSPTEEYEKNGCYSGNSIEFQGDLYLFYTANYKTPNGKLPKQAVAIMNQEGQIQKRPQPIIEDEIPGLSGELRDPYVFQKNDSFYMLLGGSKFDNEIGNGFGDHGVLILYKSDNLIDWAYQGLIDVPFPTGYMLECPSLIQVSGKDVLFLSPMGLESSDERFKNRFATIYAVGELDIDNLTFHCDYWDQLDAGFDFYAPQAFSGEENQPLLYGWFACGEPDYPVKENWLHGLTFPQQMSLEDDKLKRFPTTEILNVYSDKQAYTTSKIQTMSRYYWLEIHRGFHFTVGTSDDYWEFCYNQETKLATVSRQLLDKRIDESYGEKRSVSINNLEKVDVFVDNSFVELYLNHGEQVFTFRVFQDNCDMIASQNESLKLDIHYAKSSINS